MSGKGMKSWLSRWVKRGLVLTGVILATAFALRAYDSQRGPPLESWHTHVPTELNAAELDKADWADYLRAEHEIFDDLREEISQKLPEQDRVLFNRYFEGSPVYPGRFDQDWNRSFVLEPDGEPVGAAVLLHGLTDAPYSLRHIARRYRDKGFVAVTIRMPGHGTVPAGLTDAEWEDWMAATRLAVREAHKRAGRSKPLHIVGYSNGGALAMKYALDSLNDDQLARPDRLILISPMIGITSFARFAGLAGLPAILPAFAKAAWLSILPEFNPFKYNSFPVNAARQSHSLTTALQRRISQAASNGRLGELPPILTFQSVVDFTVSTRAIITALYGLLPDNGSELVLFDLNRKAKFGPLLSSASDIILNRVLPPAPRDYRTVIVTNESPASSQVVAQVTEAGSTVPRSDPLGLAYPSSIFSLSHVALPFPVNDGLYGLSPDGTEDFGISLGALAPRGEIGALIVNLDTLLRVTSNPFFPYMLDRIDQKILEDVPITPPEGQKPQHGNDRQGDRQR
jgi:alpha-beta hydrolase superfamily lysophospholipase